MHAITPIVLTALLIGAGCILLFAYSAYVFARVARPAKHGGRGGSLPNKPR